MVKLLGALKAVPFMLSLLVSPVEGAPSGSAVETKQEFILVMPTKAKKKVRGTFEFLGFKLQGKLNTNIDPTLRNALLEYTGPKIQITSLRRHWGTKSQHEHGKAVDLEFSHELIHWLVSEEGRLWRDKFGFTFYIEDRPGRKSLIPYKEDPVFSEFVFENRHATGPHIHLNI